MSDNVKFVLDEARIPRCWYNLTADLPSPLPPVLHPGTRKPVGPDDLAPLFPMSLIMQEVSAEKEVEIPKPVREVYKQWRPSPLYRARRLEKALQTPARIYYKYEGVSPAGSHKPNTAVAQAFYNKEAGVRKISTETGAGQWGSALALAGAIFGVEIQVFMEGREYRSPNVSNDPTKTLWGTEQLEWLKQTLLESDATFKILISPTPMVGPDVMKRDNMAGPGGFNLERDRFFAWLRDNRMLEKNFYVISGDRHWQYYSIDPAGVQEFSTGAIMDENGRMGVPPGDPLGNDPKKLIKQPYTSKEPSGGFLKVTVQPGPKPTAFFRFYDEHGVELYSVTKEATSRRR